MRLAPEIVDRAVERQRERWPSAFRSFSAHQMEMTITDTGTHLEFLTAAVWAGEPVLFSDYLAWCKVLFHSIGIPLEWLTGSLEEVRDAVADVMQPEFSQAACDTVDAALREFGLLPLALGSFVETGLPLGGPGLKYLRAALGGDRRTASQIVMDAIDGGVPLGDVYQYFFERTQTELGRMWQSNVISVTQEHIATEVTLSVMAQLSPLVSTSEKGPYTVVVAGAGAEKHGIGARIVADHFELGQWETLFVGANAPIKPMLETIGRVNADVLALSVTMSNHLLDVAEAIRALRDDPRTANTRVLVGGYPFNLVPDLWQTVGADGTAASARDGVVTAERLCS